MTCREILPLIEDYLDNSLDPGQTEQVRQHLKECKSCRNDSQGTRRLKQLLRKYSAPEPGNKYWSDILTSILSLVSNKKNGRRSANYGVAVFYKTRHACI